MKLSKMLKIMKEMNKKLVVKSKILIKKPRANKNCLR